MFSFGFGLDGDHMYPSYLIIKKHRPCCSTPSCLSLNSCLLPSLLLNPSFTSKIVTHVPMWIYLHAHLKVLMKSINNLLDSCWSPNYSKLCFSTLFSNFLSCFIYYNPQLYYFLGFFIYIYIYIYIYFLSFSDFLCNYLVHGFFLIMCRYSTEVTTCD
jgi:hypothetical protein